MQVSEELCSEAAGTGVIPAGATEARIVLETHPADGISGEKCCALQQYSEGSIGTSTEMSGCSLTLQQSQGNGSWMLGRDCSVTQLLAATASQEAAFTCPCPGPAHRAAQEMKTAPRKQRIISFGSSLPDWRFPKCFVFTADGFWVWNTCECLWDLALDVGLPSFQFTAKTRRTAAGTGSFYGSQPGNTLLDTSMAFQNWMWSTASLPCFVRLDGQIICEEAKYRHAFLYS